ncbi:MAG: hybrid sensor histidine kinase/response regulator [Fischerella sp.]|uniref:hybrid sensor histidine kinase/response regulator n=1 Tax=Fischerella sp. TaxID=1191 RepID=UPI0017EB7252|nr:hybrid sensor histidine kinase/response regulator [Fischerella sp.]NWF62655.1 hybrid sensor histidine kinase/response regulator [Fischerella sp.]
MSMSRDVHDQTYQFFIEEVPELLQAIETGLLTLRSERSSTKLHELMRAAHSLKGGAAIVELEGIITIAHRLEDIFRALYDETIEIDADLEGLLLQAYDCLRFPLTEQIATGCFDLESALTTANPIFTKIEEKLGDALTRANYYIPDSADLNVDIIASVFQVDVAHGLERLTVAIATKLQKHEIAEELRAQTELFAKFAEFLELPGFKAIAETTLAALEAHPDQALHIAQLALADFTSSREAVLAGDRTQGGSPSAALIALAETTVIDEAPIDIFNPAIASLDSETAVEHLEEGLSLSLEDLLSGKTSVTSTEVSDNSPVFLFEADIEDIEEVTPNINDLESATNIISGTEAAEELPSLPKLNLASPTPSNAIVVSRATEPSAIESVLKQEFQIRKQPQEQLSNSASNISVRVDLARLDRMNNLLGELTINRNMFALENEQIQEAIEELLRRFDRFQGVIEQIQNLSNTMLVTSESIDHTKKVVLGNGNQELGLLNESSHRSFDSGHSPSASGLQLSASEFSFTEFDALEMDRYGALHSSLQEILEEVAQIKEAVDDVAMFRGRSNRTIRQERQMLSQLRDELMWSRMLPIGNVLNRFPRVLRDLSTTHNKSVSLRLIGTEVQVEKAIVEKLYDPLLHLLRNAFDHGIEPPDVRRQQGKPEQGEIEIRAYHQGNQTVVEIRDDGQGLNLERICSRAIERGLLLPEQLAAIPTVELFELIFEPGFSTASHVSELSGRGVGLDVVKAQLQSLKGSITVTSSPGQGTTFTLRLPFTLTVAKLLVCSVGSTTVALPIDSIARIITPQATQTHQVGSQQFLTWQEQSIPVYRLADLLHYNCPLPETFSSNAVVAVSSTENTTENKIPPLLLIRREQEMFALEVDYIVAEQELVIKPFGAMIAPPNYISGCTILGSGCLIPVMNGVMLLEEFLAQSKTNMAAIAPTIESLATHEHLSAYETHTTPTVLVVDDSTTARQALVLTLEKAGYRVLQARDGWEAIEQLRYGSIMVQLIISDVEMPNMNGFEFLEYCRQDPQLATIPVAMLTTRGNSKHRNLAMLLGASAYFTKPYIELELLSALSNIVGQNAPQKIPYL